MVTVPVNESVKLIDSSNPNREFEFALSGNGVRLGRSRATATEEAAKKILTGDRGTITLESGESLYAFNFDPKGNGRPAEVDIEKAGFIIQFQPRSVLATVETTAEDREAPAASDDFVFESGANVSVAAGGSLTEDFEVPDRAADLFILVEASGAAEVTVSFKPAPSAATIATRGPTQDPTYATAGGAANQIFKSVLIVAPHIEVNITDTSGSSNTVNYALYAR